MVRPLLFLGDVFGLFQACLELEEHLVGHGVVVEILGNLLAREPEALPELRPVELDGIRIAVQFAKISYHEIVRNAPGLGAVVADVFYV